MRHMATLILLAGGLLWSCTGPGGPGEGTVPITGVAVETAGADGRRCAATRYRVLIGQPIDGIDIAAMPRPLRVYPTDSRITGDERPERMNIVVGPDGRVVKVRCG